MAINLICAWGDENFHRRRIQLIKRDFVAWRWRHHRNNRAQYLKAFALETFLILVSDQLIGLISYRLQQD
jgi:hypothetical protein